jgi:hypothetical protein
MKGMIRRVLQALAEPVPARFLALRALDQWLNFLRYPAKLKYGSVERPGYGYGLLHAALQARKLGFPEISALEFGVAGGNGLVALERHAHRVQAETGVRVTTYGFDAGTGMPPPADFRDMPYVFQAGYFRMDEDKLRARLKTSRLLLGPIQDIITEFLRGRDTAPIGFISFDLDYYSSTVSALQIFEADENKFLPRVICYFDDIIGDLDDAYNEFTGELLAIREFNAAHEHIKVARAQGLRFYGSRLPREWPEQIFVAHFFQHNKYCRPIADVTQLPLKPDRRRDKPAAKNREA